MILILSRKADMDPRRPGAEDREAEASAAAQAAKYPFRIEFDGFDWNVIENASGREVLSGLTEEGACKACRRRNEESIA